MRAGFAALLLLAGAASGQDFKITTDVNRVVLGVSVQDRQGASLRGLKADDFVVYEDGRPQQIRFFSSEDLPVTVGLVVDNSGSMRTKRGDTANAALEFVSLSNPGDEVFVVNFNDRAWLGLPPGVPFSSDPEVLRTALCRQPPQGRTALYDAIRLGLDHLREGTRDRKVLVVITDGGDNSSQIDFDSVLTRAESSNAAIYTVGLFDPQDPDRHPKILKKLARATGGEVFLPEGVDRIRPVAEQIARDIRSQYTIAYAPSDLADDHYRNIRVEVRAPGHSKPIVRTRAGYLPPSKAASMEADGSRP